MKDSTISKVMSELAKRRAAKLSPEHRSAIAKAGGKARWKGRKLTTPPTKPTI